MRASERCVPWNARFAERSSGFTGVAGKLNLTLIFKSHGRRRRADMIV
jgi:hypothetical protein